MRTLHEALYTNSHLKNSGRMQYGLFLKGIGVTLEDALRFWRDAFLKKVDGVAFEKKYAYSIRHYFGKEGRQTNYTPFGCQKIISSSVGPGEYHGCPFRHMDRDSLCQKLTSCGVFASSKTLFCLYYRCKKTRSVPLYLNLKLIYFRYDRNIGLS